MEYVLNHAEVKVIFCAEAAQLKQLLKVVPKCPSIRAIVLFACVRSLLDCSKLSRQNAGL